MLKVIAGTSPLLLAATVVVGTAAAQENPATTDARSQSSQQVTAVGCVVRNGSVDPDKGTRTLNIAPGALALTDARILGTEAGRSNTGSVPQDKNSGTIPDRTIVGTPSQEPSTTVLALTGDKATGLNDVIGRRVEIVGRLAPDTTPRGTTGTARDAAPVPGVGTREERPGEGSAHPSAEIRKLEVVSFRGVTGGCD